MDKEEQPFTAQAPVAPPTGATVLSPSLSLNEWNMVLGSVAKGSIETHLDLFMKLKQSLESEIKKAGGP